MQITFYRIVEFSKLLFDLEGWALKQVNCQKPEAKFKGPLTGTGVLQFRREWHPGCFKVEDFATVTTITVFTPS